MVPIPIYNFRRRTDDQLLTKALHIIACMTDNIHFPDATPRVTKAETATNEFKVALLDAQDGGKTKTAIKNQKRKVLENALKELALYVRLNCNDDITIMLTSGYDGQNDKEPLPAPGAPENFKVEYGPGSGTINASVDTHKGAKVYVYEYALVPEAGNEPHWVKLIGSRKQKIRGLVPRNEYMFRSAIKGNSDDLIYSETLRRFVV
jgi:hypothetical protein